MLLSDAMLVVLMLLGVINGVLGAACFWMEMRLTGLTHDGGKLESLHRAHRQEIDELERQIVVAQAYCAAQNPKAAEILLARERARRTRMTQPEYEIYLRLFDHQLGGEPPAELPFPIPTSESPSQDAGEGEPCTNP
jgi:hypothetical protein